MKGISDKDQISSSMKGFLPRFLGYTLFDVPVDLLPLDDIVTTHTSSKFLLFNAKLLPCCLNLYLKPKIIRSSVERVLADILLEHSRVLKDVPDGPDGLTRYDLMDMLHLIFGIAAFGGTSALASTSLTQMPEGYADEVIHDEDNAKLRNAVLECARLNAPVPIAQSIVDDDEGFTTQIGRKAIKFPKGTVLCTGYCPCQSRREKIPQSVCI